MLTLLSRFAVIISVLAFCSPLLAQEVAITMDNPNVETTPLLSPQARDLHILAVLKKHHLQTTLFVQGAQVDNPQGRALLERWDQAGHLLGNHTYSHQSLDAIGPDKDSQDTLLNEKFLQHYTHFRKIFRFPFLNEGKTADVRDKFREFLTAHKYTNGSVTIDASDWYISDRLEARLAKNPNADVTPYKQYYLQHIWNRAQYYDQLALKVLGRSPKHTLLIHHNLLNALFLDDLIHMFKQHGWKVIDSERAFTDPVFNITPHSLPAGQSLIWALAKQTGQYDSELRYPGEDGEYEKEAMDKAGL
jgi:peptidoglycan/xylan/chitin deacetylase (PgdA/CDA1 family)